MTVAVAGSRGGSSRGWRWGSLADGAAGVDDSVPGFGSPLPDADRLLVVKVGGSLLSLRGWPGLVRELVIECVPRPRLVVVGGGAIVDGVRAIDRVASRPPEFVHRLAIDAMRLTAELVAEAVGLPLVAGYGGDVAAVMDVSAWLRGDGRGVVLPAGWHVTSDSIAARVAETYGGGVLLAKSVPPPPCPVGADRRVAVAAAGWVDGYFPQAARGIEELLWASPAGALGRVH